MRKLAAVFSVVLVSLSLGVGVASATCIGENGCLPGKPTTTTTTPPTPTTIVPTPTTIVPTPTTIVPTPTPTPTPVTPATVPPAPVTVPVAPTAPPVSVVGSASEPAAIVVVDITGRCDLVNATGVIDINVDNAGGPGQITVIVDGVTTVSDVEGPKTISVEVPNAGRLVPVVVDTGDKVEAFQVLVECQLGTSSCPPAGEAGSPFGLLGAGALGGALLVAALMRRRKNDTNDVAEVAESETV